MSEPASAINYNEPWDQERPRPLVSATWDHQIQHLYHIEKEAFDADYILSLRTPEVEMGQSFIRNKRLMRKITDFMCDINEMEWEYDLWGMYEYPVLSSYVPKRFSYAHDLHTDYYCLDRSKLGITIMLQPADAGGDLWFVATPPEQVSLDKGDAIVFPGWLAHKVLPVTKGERISLVTWLAGPPWR